MPGRVSATSRDRSPRLRRAGVPLEFSTLPLAAEGATAVERVRLARVDPHVAPRRRAGASSSATRSSSGFGFVPSSELARQAGCAYRWDAEAGGWVIDHDEWMRTSVPSVLVAGEITGIAGAEQAIEEGRLAALGALVGLERLDLAAASAWRGRFCGSSRSGAASATSSAGVSPRGWTRSPRSRPTRRSSAGARSVTAGALRGALAANPHLGTLDAVKLLTRVGMGACQGRMCQPAVTQLVAAATGQCARELGPYRARPAGEADPALASSPAAHEPDAPRIS